MATDEFRDETKLPAKEMLWNSARFLLVFSLIHGTTVCSSSLFSRDLERHQYELDPVNAMFWNCLYSLL